MGIGKDGFYHVDDVLQKVPDATFFIILGGRDLGKSFAIKTHCLQEAVKGSELAYIRRFDREMKQHMNEAYWADVPLKKYTKLDRDTIICDRSALYLGNTDETGKRKKAEKIGNTFALNIAGHYKSTMYPKLGNAIFEEFITDEMYVPDEPNKLQNLVSTLARDKQFKVWMIGNTMSRVCPYFTEWSLTNIPNMKPGQIDRYEMKQAEGTTITIAVEFAPPRDAVKSSKMFFGKSRDMIVSGQWHSNTYPHIPVDQFDKLYDINLNMSHFKFCVNLMQSKRDQTNLVLYITPAKVHKTIRTITDEFTLDPLSTPCLRSDLGGELLIAKLFKESRVAFCNNLCGEDFYNALKNTSIAPFSLM